MASKRGIRRKQCDGKVKHKTQQDGMIAISKLHRHRGYQGLMHCYRCSFCGQWHIGHVQKGGYRNRGPHAYR